MEKIIVVCFSFTGKTTVINDIYDSLVEFDATIVKEETDW